MRGLVASSKNYRIVPVVVINSSAFVFWTGALEPVLHRVIHKWVYCVMGHLTLWSMKVKVRARVTLRLAVYHHSVRLGIRPLETHDQRFLFQLNPCVTSSLTRR
jgi:hypothetical protein